MHSPILRITGALLTLGAIGCGAMSPSAYDELAAQVAERNLERQRAAAAAFQARGYETVADISRYVLVEDPIRQRCIDATLQRNVPGTARGADIPETAATPEPAPPSESPSSSEPGSSAANTDAAASARVRIEAIARAGDPPPPTLVLEADIADACAFFGGQSDVLYGEDPTGQAVGLVAIADGVSFARTPAGQIAYVTARIRVISRRLERIEMTCNEMPQPPPSPLDRAQIRVVIAPAPTEQVSMDVEQEELDYECTDIVQ